jgi:hypothetical protein
MVFSPRKSRRPLNATELSFFELVDLLNARVDLRWLTISLPSFVPTQRDGTWRSAYDRPITTRCEQLLTKLLSINKLRRLTIRIKRREPSPLHVLHDTQKELICILRSNLLKNGDKLGDKQVRCQLGGNGSGWFESDDDENRVSLLPPMLNREKRYTDLSTSELGTNEEESSDAETMDTCKENSDGEHTDEKGIQEEDEYIEEDHTGDK